MIHCVYLEYNVLLVILIFSGVEFEGLPGKSHGATAGAIAKACHDRDLLVLPCGPYDTLRFIPPLNISSQELNDGMDVFCDAVESVLAEN